jgi:hypothetical protein
MKVVFIIALGILAGSIVNAESTSIEKAKIQKLKAEIIHIAKSATAKFARQNEFDPKTRKKLDPLVQALAATAKPKTVQEQLVASVGSWKNLWSDLPYTTAIANQIYQVVFPTGYYYNVSKYVTDKGEVYTSLIRGAYTLKDKDFEIAFTKAVKSKGYPPKGTDLYRQAMLAELGLYDDNVDQENSQGLGRPGTLTTLYIDNDIRVIGGELRENGVTDSLFILVPQASIQ